VRSCRDNVASSFSMAIKLRGFDCDCQPQGGRELGTNRMVKISESLLTRRHRINSARGWMRRRHPSKSLSWCYRKYLTSIGNRNYVLQGILLDRRGKPHTIRLTKATDVPIKRHVKIKATANPYDPNWEIYLCAVSSAIRRATNVVKSLGTFCTHRA
jgi:hypothetical protein